MVERETKKLKGHQTENGENERILEREKNWFELMQYTGLKDKNGVEIYEGDIIYCEECDRNSEIKWDTVSAMFSFHRPNIHDRYDVSTNTMEIIGNIYENPELLKEVKC